MPSAKPKCSMPPRCVVCSVRIFGEALRETGAQLGEQRGQPGIVFGKHEQHRVQLWIARAAPLPVLGRALPGVAEEAAAVFTDHAGDELGRELAQRLVHQAERGEARVRECDLDRAALGAGCAARDPRPTAFRATRGARRIAHREQRIRARGQRTVAAKHQTLHVLGLDRQVFRRRVLEAPDGVADARDRARQQLAWIDQIHSNLNQSCACRSFIRPHRPARSLALRSTLTAVSPGTPSTKSASGSDGCAEKL